MRVFVAILPSERLKDEIMEFKDEYFDLPVHWIERDNLHLTLLPPWETDEPELALGLLEQLSDTTHQFQIRLEQADLGPTKQAPRLIWAEGKMTQPLLGLVSELHALFHNNLPADIEPKLHLTLARFAASDYPFPGKPVLPKSLNWLEQVDSIALLESILSKGGADYRLIGTVKLGE